ncbi:MAG: tRNA (guanosine(37)-N1)-methyltransferase TrmD [Candidatus Bostrichicola ureolyticus]|nr:MAG: tRNA (guanosine(37)-N1)-methyltransferase TrmD [Candidatus Bostrichicola ureolyticus]
MRIDIIAVIPKLLDGPLSHSIIKRAIDKELVNIYIHDIHQYGIGKYKQIDDYPYGKKVGMVMRIEPIYKCIEKLKSERNYDEIIFMAPDGKQFIQSDANLLSLKENLIILCGHYKGVDQRVRDHLITREISIGKYVLSSGEIAAAVIIDAIIRLIPGVLGNIYSALTDSFQNESEFEPPIYTRPSIYKGWKVPEVLLSGDLKKIEFWKNEQIIQRNKNL